METIWIILGIFCFLGLVITLVFISIYNKLVRQQNDYGNAFAQIEVQLKRRYDLIPNLVEVAKGYMAHEKETLENVIAARGAAVNCTENAARNPGDPGALAKLGEAEGALSATLGRLMMVTENYPDLKANANMMQLTEEMTSTENRISFARQSFNDFVTEFNTSRKSFPDVIIASLFNFGEASLLEFQDQTHHEVPKAQF